jgi:hypothetical protein
LKIDAKRIKSAYLISLERDIAGDMAAAEKRTIPLHVRDSSLSRFESPTVRTKRSTKEILGPLRRFAVAGGFMQSIVLDECLLSGNLSEKSREPGVFGRIKKRKREREKDSRREGLFMQENQGGRRSKEVEVVGEILTVHL